MAGLRFEQAAHHIVLEDCIAAVEAATRDLALCGETLRHPSYALGLGYVLCGGLFLVDLPGDAFRFGLVYGCP
jgi:hypothetical protein